MMLGGVQSQRLLFLYLVSYRVDDIDMLGERSDYLCDCLYCKVVVTSDLWLCGCHAKSMAWTNRVISPGFIMWATVLWLFGCLASLDGPLVTNSLFSQTCLSHLLLGVAWAVASFLRGEGEDVKHTFMGGLMAHTSNPCLSWYHDSSWHGAFVWLTVCRLFSRLNYYLWV